MQDFQANVPFESVFVVIFLVLLLLLLYYYYKSKSRTPKLLNRAEIFAKLDREGQINSALRYLSEEDCGSVLPSSDDIMRQLTDKHPSAQEA